MPVICKISLDASEYRSQLQKVIEETKAFDNTLDEKNVRVTVDTENAKASLSDLSNKSNNMITVGADVDTAIDALNTLPQVQDQSVSVTADVSPVQAALNTLSQVHGDVINEK